MATSGADGRFRIPRVPAGTYEVHVRGRDGGEASTEVAVPGGVLDVVLGAAKPGKAAKRG
jgi:hypothetical protein